MAMVTLGVDAHKRTHTVVAVDAMGLRLAERTVVATIDGHAEVLSWAQQWPERRWAIEDCRHVSKHLEVALLQVGEVVSRVPPQLTAVTRRTMRRRGKSDPIDAMAVAQACQREPGLPCAQSVEPTRDIRLLVDHRDDLIGERTRVQNRLRWHLHELAPGGEPPAGALDRYCVLKALRRRVAGRADALARIIRYELDCSESLTREINARERELTVRVRQLAPSLLALRGCATLTAAKVLGEVGDIRRFHSSSAFARHNGTAPIPVWSGNQQRFRLSRGGNRQINYALHHIALTQLRVHEPAKTYVARLRASGKTGREAMRCLKRHLSNEVYRRLRAVEATPAHSATRRAAA